MNAPAPARAFGHPLVATRPPLCPEIVLRLIEGEVDLEAACADHDVGRPPPYWAFCWGAGQALARYVLDHPETVRGRDVTDFGCGSGIVAIAAARAGAAAVTAVDCDPEALAAAAANARLNGLRIATATALPARSDVLLGADVLYEPAAREAFERARGGARRVIVADPERAGTPDPGVPAAIRHEARTVPDVDSPRRTAAVFVLA